MKYVKVRFPNSAREFTYSCDDDGTDASSIAIGAVWSARSRRTALSRRP